MVKEKYETGRGEIGRVDERKNNYGRGGGWQLRGLK